MKRYLVFGGFMVLLGVAVIYAPVLLPRSWFGELGHGDGMSLIGVMLWGALICALGVLSIVGGAVSALFKRQTKETD